VEEPAASEGLKVEGLKVVEKRRSRCGSSFSATFDFKTLRLSDAAGSSNIERRTKRKSLRRLKV
jgi:hypothetical protein